MMSRNPRIYAFWSAALALLLSATLMSCGGDDTAGGNLNIHEGDENACGGDGDLLFEGETALPGDACGICGDGALACDGEDALACEAASSLNACGACGELEAEPDESCGLDAVWTCSDGELHCLPEGGQNLCDGEQILEARPGDPCGPCDLDIYICSGEDAVVCNGQTPCPDLQFETAPVDDITATSATLNGVLSQLPLDAPQDYGFCWSLQEEPSESNGICESLGAPFDLGEFWLEVDTLEPGTTYFVRAYMTTDESATIFANELTFTTLAPSPMDLSATTGDHEDRVELSWSEIDGALEYIIWRDGTELDTVSAGQSNFDDFDAYGAPLPEAPTSLTASQGDFSGFVRLTWDAAETEGGTEHVYELTAVFRDAVSAPSPEAVGYRGAPEIAGYDLEIDGAAWIELDATTSFDDLDAPLGELTVSGVEASQGEFSTHVTLETLQVSDSPGAEVSYRVRARTDAGVGAESTTTSGYRSVGGISYQWERSAADADADFSPLPGATAVSHLDYDAPSNGDGRYYRVVVTAAGAATATSSAARGHRAVAPQISTLDVSDVQADSAQAQANLIFLGIPEASAHGLCWSTSPEPTYPAAADTNCLNLGGATSTGTFSIALQGLSPATVYFVRAFAANSVATVYGSDFEFETLPPAPTGVSATNGISADFVSVNWDPVPAATSYRLYRDGSPIATITETTFDDVEAGAGGLPTMPVVEATKGSFTDRVNLSWSAASTSSGTTHTYHVVAISSAGDSEPSASDTGFRAAYPVLGYDIRIDGQSWTDLGMATDYDDTDAPAPTITTGTPTASDNFEDYVALSISGHSANSGGLVTYEVRARNFVGTGDAGSDDGYRGVGGLSLQWERSAGDADSNYSDLAGATSSTHDDFSAPPDGQGRYYRVRFEADGAAPALSPAVRGTRMTCGIVMTGPTLPNTTGGWANSGMQFEALTNITLTSFVYNNQGMADTIEIRSTTRGLLDTISTPAGQNAFVVQGSWDFDAGEVIRVTAAHDSNGRWVSYSSYPTANSHISVQGVTQNGTLHTSWWFHFTDLQTCGR